MNRISAGILVFLFAGGFMGTAHAQEFRWEDQGLSLNGRGFFINIAGKF